MRRSTSSRAATSRPWPSPAACVGTGQGAAWRCGLVPDDPAAASRATFQPPAGRAIARARAAGEPPGVEQLVEALPVPSGGCRRARCESGCTAGRRPSAPCRRADRARPASRRSTAQVVAAQAGRRCGRRGLGHHLMPLCRGGARSPHGSGAAILVGLEQADHRGVDASASRRDRGRRDPGELPPSRAFSATPGTFSRSSLRSEPRSARSEARAGSRCPERRVRRIRASRASSGKST